MASQGAPAKGLADGDAVGAIARGLVREYLLRKGMTQALATFDKEAPPSSSVGTTGDLIKSLRLSSLRQRSTSQDRPVDTVLELLAQYFYASELSSSATPPAQEAAPPASPPTKAAAPAIPPTKAAVPAIPPTKAAAPTPAEEAAAAPETAAPAAAAPTSFWDRINAAKAKAAAAATQQQASEPATSAAAPSTEAGSGRDAAVVEAPAAQGSFWARLRAKRAAAAGAGGGGDAADPKAAAAAAAAPPPAQAFVAPDGKSFSDQTEYRRYVFEGWYTFAGKTGETLRKLPGEVAGQPFNLRDLTDCTVELLDHCDAMHVEKLRRCNVFIAASSESVFMRDCHDCDVWLACKQLRTRDCSNCRLFLYSKTDPIVETSTEMAFAPFTGSSPQLDKMFLAAHLIPERNMWNRVFDFNKGETCVPEPHWFIMPAEQVKSRPIEVDGLAPPVNPVVSAQEGAAAGFAPVSVGGPSGGMIAFDIRSTSQSEAERALASASKLPS